MGLTPDEQRAAHRRVWTLVTAMAVAGVVATPAVLRGAPAPEELVLATAVALGFAAAERWIVSLHLSDRTQSMTLSELPLMAGLFLLSPAALLISRVLGIIPSLVISRKLPPYKVAFNVALQLLETVAALAILQAVGAAGPRDAGRAALVAVLVPVATSALGAVGVVGARSTLDGRWHRGQALQVARHSAGPSIATSGFGLVALVLAEASPWLLWAPALTVAVLYASYRTHVRLMHLTERQAMVLRFTSETTGREGMVETARQIVATTVALPGVAGAGLARLADGAEPTWLARAGSDGRLPEAGGDLLGPDRQPHDPAVSAWALDEDGAVLLVDLGSARPAADLRSTVEQIANHARVVVANAAHAEALERQAREADARALVDPLTGLPNRTALLQGIDAALKAGRPFSTVLIDLDDFKEINDALGHEAGDRVLRQVAARMQGLREEVLMLSRLGGDEFAVLVAGGEIAARELADRLLAAIGRPVDVPPYSLEVDASAGIAVHPAHGVDRDALLRNADLAMYEAKGSSTSVAVFGAAAAGRAVRHLAISSSFRAALGTDQLSQVYQPKIDLRSGQLVGVEVLARWTHPELGPVAPDEFIRVAEQAGLLPQLTERIIDTALSWQRRWAEQGLDISMAVNISPQGLLDADLPPSVARALDRYQVPADRLTLEITEGSVISDPQRTLAVLGRLSRLGVRIAIDDFGTGYSSLAYLQQVPADEIKIDKSFVQPMGADPHATPLVNGIIRLCHELGFSVVAEGIESAAVESVLRRLGCDAGQGYHIARPMAASSLLSWAAARSQELRIPDSAA